MKKCTQKLSAKLKQPPKQKIYLDLETTGGPVIMDEAGKVVISLKDLIKKFKGVENKASGVILTDKEQITYWELVKMEMNLLDLSKKDTLWNPA